jgi:hypothetical protein
MTLASSSRGLASPSEFDWNRPPRPSRARPLPWGSCPFSACDRGSPLRPGLPRPIRCALGVLSPPRRFASATTSTALFHAAPARGVSALRSFPLRGEGPRLSTPSCPPAVGSNGQTLPRSPSPGSWALLPPEVRCATEEWSLRPARCSLGLRLSRVRPPPRWQPASRRLLPRASRRPCEDRRCSSESRSRRGEKVSVETHRPS